MKQTIIFLFALFIFAGCTQNDEPVILQEIGTVVDYAGVDHCKFIIELENGKKIQPVNYPEEFTFFQGQKLLVSYTELPDKISTCGKGTPSDVVYVEEIAGGAPLTEVEASQYNTLPDDPVFIHQVLYQENFLQMKISFSGGCRDHDFYLVKINKAEEDSTVALIELRHNANGDACEAALSKNLRYDLSSLKDEGYTHFLFKARLPDGSTYMELFELNP